MTISAKLMAVSLICLFVACGGGSGKSSERETIEYQLACINAEEPVPYDDITVARFRSLLSQLSESFVENPQAIADMTVKAHEVMKTKGISESLLKMMEGLNQSISSKRRKQAYSSLLAMYVALRDKGVSHDEVISGLKSISHDLEGS